MISHIYAWSLVFEPLLYFGISTQAITGVNLNIGRILETIVVLCLLPKGITVFFGKRFNPRNAVYKNYVIFFIIAMCAGLIGALSGAYQTPVTLDYSGASIIDRILNSNFIRPFFEYFIYLYYFIYFTVLPQYLLKGAREVTYFLSIFTTVFVISFVVGLADFGLHAADTGLYLGREMFGDRDVGMRFHGFAGEPRDAVVYLFFGLAMLHLRAYYLDKDLSKKWIVAIVAAAIMTQSASGLVGIALFMIMYLLHRFSESMSVQKILVTLVFCVATVFLAYVAATNSERMMLYVDALPSIYEILRSGQGIPSVLVGQMNDIFPIYKMLLNVIELKWLPVVIGSGLGSSSDINRLFASTLDLWGGLANPHSQLVRIIYETGLIGLLFFYRAFVRPVEYLVKHVEKRNKEIFILMMLLLLGCFFGHRSPTIFIYLGILVAVFRLPQRQGHRGYGKASGEAVSAGFEKAPDGLPSVP